DGLRCPPAANLVGFRQRSESGRRRYHGAGVVDSGLNLAPVAEDRAVLTQPIDVSLSHCRDLSGVEAPECFLKRVPLGEHDRPAQSDLEYAEGERLEYCGLVVGAGTPDLVVIAAEGGIASASPGTAW